MNWRQRYAMEQQHYDKLQGTAEKFFGSGGSVDVHHIGAKTEIDPIKADYLKGQKALIDQQLDGCVLNSARHLALTGLSRALGGLHQLYSTGSHEGLPEELWSVGSGHPTQALLAKDKDNNVVGHLTTFDMPKNQTGGAPASGVIGTGSLSSGAGTALQHTFVHHVSSGQGLNSTIYDQAGPVQDDARKFHDSIGRNVEGLNSWWNTSDIAGIKSNTTPVPGAAITHIGK